MATPAKIQKARIPNLIPDSQFPDEALANSVQVKPNTNYALPNGGQMLFTWNIASVADSVTPWGRNVALRDRQLRDFWPTEPYLAGTMASIAFRNAAYDWQIRGPSEGIETAVTDMLKAALAGDAFGWTNFVKKFTADMMGQDNGGFVELIRDPGMDANSPFKNEKAPVLGIGHLDANQCTRTGDPEYPVIYLDRDGDMHKLAWYQVIPFADFPSSIEKMNGVGYCAVTRALRLGQIMRSIFIFKDEKISGRYFKQIHFVSGVSKQDIKDEVRRGQEEADNKGTLRYIEPAILASLDPEKPVSAVTIDLASLPDGFNIDTEMKWYIAGLALDFGVDYQELAPLPGGNLGSSEQSMILHRKSSGKGPAMFMKLSEAFKNYGVLPRGCEMVFEDRDEEKELDKQTLRKLFQEEMALAIRNGYLDPDTARKIGIARGLYSERELASVPKGYGWELTATSIQEKLTGILPGTPEIANAGPGDTGTPGAKQPVGPTGGNTMAEDAARTNVGVPNNTGGNRLMKEMREERNNLLDVVKLAIRALNQPKIIEKQAPMPINLNVDSRLSASSTKKIVNEVKKAMPKPNISVNVPAQKRPIVNVSIPAQKPPVVNVTVPTPQVQIENHVQVPEQKPPVVNINIPPRPKNVAIEYDKNGKPKGLKAE